VPTKTFSTLWLLQITDPFLAVTTTKYASLMGGRIQTVFKPLVFRIHTNFRLLYRYLVSVHTGPMSIIQSHIHWSNPTHFSSPAIISSISHVHGVKVYVFLSILQHNYIKFINKIVTKSIGVFWCSLYMSILSYSSVLTILRPQCCRHLQHSMCVTSI
jgi:hypothetical protein